MVLKTEGNTYATLAASPSPLRGKPTQAQDIASPHPTAGGSSLTPASPPTPENRLTQKSIQSTKVWLNRSRAAARARGIALAVAGPASDQARAGAAAADPAGMAAAAEGASHWGRAAVEMSPAARASR